MGSVMEVLWTFSIYLVCTHPSTIVHGIKNRRSRINHIPLPVCSWIIQGSLHCQLDLSILRRKFLRYHCYCCWMCTNDPLLRLLLSLHNKSFKRKEASASSLKHTLLLEYHNQIYQETLSVSKAHHIK